MGYFDDPSGADPLTGATPNQAAGYFGQAYDAYKRLIASQKPLGAGIPDLVRQGVPLSDPRYTDAAMPLAMSIGPGIMAGPKALTANRELLGQAIDMARSGAPREDILKNTGWFQGPDTNWRFEINDGTPAPGSPSAPGGRVLRAAGDTHRLDSAIYHPALAAAYPDLMRSIDVNFNQDAALGNAGGQFRRSVTGAPSNIDLRGAPGTYTGGQRIATDPQFSTLLHEIQHAIQAREGWQGGSNPDYYRTQVARSGIYPEEEANPGLRAADYTHRSTADALRAGLGSGAQARIIVGNEFKQLPLRMQMRDVQDQAAEYLKNLGIVPETNSDRYWRTAGEVEARNVQTRREMKMNQFMMRNSLPPWKTQRVPDAQQILDPSKWDWLRAPLSPAPPQW